MCMCVCVQNKLIMYTLGKRRIEKRKLDKFLTIKCKHSIMSPTTRGRVVPSFTPNTPSTKVWCLVKVSKHYFYFAIF